MKEYPFQLEFQVRDYECDMQGHVNNAVYLNYLEHCRHEFIKELGLDFSELVRRGISLVIIRAEVDYKYSLRSGQRFLVGVSLERVSLYATGLSRISTYCQRKTGSARPGHRNWSQRQRATATAEGNQCSSG